METLDLKELLPEGKEDGARLAMIKLSTYIVLIFALTACAGAVIQSTPLPASAGPRGYMLYTVYGGLDGTREGASFVLDREGRRMCEGNFVIVKEESTQRKTIWGANNGQIDFHREISCR